MRAYAEKHGYAVHVFTKAFDLSERAKGRHPAWQKLLVAEQPEVQQYDRVVYLDTDVMLNPDAPPVDVPVGRIGAVTWKGSYREDPMYLEAFRETWRDSGLEWIREANIQSFGDLAVSGGYPRYEDWINTGVLVFSPDHASLFRNIYDQHDQTRYTSFEQQAASYELCVRHADLLYPMDRRWNVVWYIHRLIHYPFLDLVMPDSFIVGKCIDATLDRVYALHFAADGNGQREARAFVDQRGLMEVAA